jgi:hypothetical protein
MAHMTGEGAADLYARYEFHLNLQDVGQAARRSVQAAASTVRLVSSKQGGLSKAELNNARAALDGAYRGVDAACRKAQTILLPALPGVPEGVPLSGALLREPLIHPMPRGNKVDREWVNALGKQASEIDRHSRRLYFKSMGAILLRQEAIARRYRSEVLGTPPDLPGDDPSSAPGT